MKYGFNYVLLALFMVGLTQYALRTLTKETRRSCLINESNLRLASAK